jgi:hypothetical protein
MNHAITPPSTSRNAIFQNDAIFFPLEMLFSSMMGYSMMLFSFHPQLISNSMLFPSMMMLVLPLHPPIIRLIPLHLPLIKLFPSFHL